MNKPPRDRISDHADWRWLAADVPAIPDWKTKPFERNQCIFVSRGIAFHCDHIGIIRVWTRAGPYRPGCYDRHGQWLNGGTGGHHLGGSVDAIMTAINDDPIVMDDLAPDAGADTVALNPPRGYGGCKTVARSAWWFIRNMHRAGWSLHVGRIETSVMTPYAPVCLAMSNGEGRVVATRASSI